MPLKLWNITTFGSGDATYPLGFRNYYAAFNKLYTSHVCVYVCMCMYCAFCLCINLLWPQGFRDIWWTDVNSPSVFALAALGRWLQQGPVCDAVLLCPPHDFTLQPEQLYPLCPKPSEIISIPCLVLSCFIHKESTCGVLGCHEDTMLGDITSIVFRGHNLLPCHVSEY